MRISKQLPLLVTAILFLGAAHAQAGTLPHQNHNTKATSYLALLDQGKLQEAWLSMAFLFRDINIQQQWQQRISAIRQAYGSTTSREFRRSSYRTTYRNAPDGVYVMIQFDSSFEYKSKGVETVVLQCPPTNECSVIDYIIN